MMLNNVLLRRSVENYKYLKYRGAYEKTFVL